MAGLILCQEVNVRSPYYVPELGVHLYTGEELSYFIFNHVLLIPDDFLEERLFVFLGELGYARLEERLRGYRGGDIYEVLPVILQEIRYYSSPELFRFDKTLETLRAMPEAERRKAKGDYLFGEGLYHYALREYEDILAMDAVKLGDANFTGQVWHNMGSVYARMEAVREAMRCYRRAYSLLHDEKILEEIYALCQLSAGVTLPEELKAEISPEQEEKFRRRFSERERQAVFEGKALEAAALRDRPPEERADAYARLLENWKNEYRRNQV